MSAKKGLALIVVIAAAYFGWGSWNGPERQIHDVLDGIATRLHHDTPMSGLGAASAAAGLQEYFALETVVELGEPYGSLMGRDAVIAAATRVIAGTPALDVEFVDRQIAFQSSAGSAGSQKDWADVTCNVTAVMRDRAGQPTRDAREVSLTMHIVEGRWVIARAKALTVLEPVQ